MNQNVIPTHLDWVRKRSDCSLQTLFKSLSDVVTSDIESALRHQARLRATPLKLTTELLERSVTVTVIWDLGNGPEEQAVTFRRVDENEAVEVAYLTETNGRVLQRMFTAHRQLSATGECVLAVGGHPLELWQISRLALEEFLFGSVVFLP